MRRRQTESGRYSIWAPSTSGSMRRAALCRVTLAERNLLIGGEPGSGKSVALNLIVGHAALSFDCRLVLVDGKRVELGLWRTCADAFIGPNIADGIGLLRRSSPSWMVATTRRSAQVSGRSRLRRAFLSSWWWSTNLPYFSATVGDSKQQKEFVNLVRDLVARGRAAGVIVVGATQRPSSDIVPTSLRDLFGYRLAFRCSTDSSSDVILGHGWTNEGYTASEIDPAPAASAGSSPRVACRVASEPRT